VTSTTEEKADFEPRRPGLIAVVVYALAALTLCWPMLAGKFLAGPDSDQYMAGYSFRAFAAHYFREHGSIPQWNPYIFGGLPFVGAAHGDIFYPTAWLRWILPTDVAMNLGFALHIVLAGLTMYGLLRCLKLSWAPALVGGLGYELTGIVISLVHPGHDGKLFVASLAPWLFMGIVLAVRDRRFVGYGIIALATGLALHGHPQASQYLMIASAIWGAFWLFGSEGPNGTARFQTVGLAALAVTLGVGLYAIYALPMIEYVPFSPRAQGGFNTGWEHAISYSLPPEELFGVVLPRIFGLMNPTYFGRNGGRLHSEYLGPAVLLLATIGLGGRDRRVARFAFGTLGVFFLLISLGGHTPVFRLWYELVPLSDRLRAPGQAFFLVAMALAFFAALGTERLFRKEGSVLRLAVAGGLIGLIAILGAGGLLQGVAEDLARNAGFQGAAEAAIANAGALRADGLRLLIVTAAAAGLLFAIRRNRMGGRAALAATLVAVLADSWLVGRLFFVFSPGASVSYGDDAITRRVNQTPKPYRVWVPAGRLGQLGPYPRSWLMAREVPQLFGYHGNEVRYFDELFGGKEDWQNQVNPNLLNLYAIQYLVIAQAQEVPGFHQILGPVQTTPGSTGFLYQVDTAPPYARVMSGALKVPDAQIVPALIDPRFPWDRVVLYSDSATVSPATIGNTAPEPSALQARVTEWRAGRIGIGITDVTDKEQYLVVAENWYKDWHATIDGKPAPVLRGHHAMLSVALPPGAREVVLEYRSRAYQRGRLISALSMAGIAGLFAVPLAKRKRRGDG